MVTKIFMLIQKSFDAVCHTGKKNTMRISARDLAEWRRIEGMDRFIRKGH